ncbi:MAG: hypothetical protein RBR40_14415 [Tenuifilaceae bacterium]|nr:hypothetical protein [Tenuifilaceae bacterium]
MKIPLLIFRLHSAVCFSSAPLSKILSFFGLLQIATFAPAAGGWVLRIEEKRREEKRREEKRREEKEATSGLKFLKLDFQGYCSHLKIDVLFPLVSTNFFFTQP